MNRLFPRFLRTFAFSLIVVVALAIVGASQARAALGDAHWLASLLPVDAPGISIWLATAADRSIAENVADRVGVFRGVLASDGLSNLKGRRKLEATKRKKTNLAQPPVVPE